MKIRFVGKVSGPQSVAASDETPYTWTNDKDGNILLEEVVIAYDSTLQADGTFTISINGFVVADDISSLSTINSIELPRLDVPVPKGATVAFLVKNANTTTAGHFQVMVNAYEAD
ncbi:MAG: hypothetical protein PHV13_02935 [Candidatus ainarchaeum sp.]|nr:hypothetical protein [Candidatus ainarchaeum sp.]